MRILIIFLSLSIFCACKKTSNTSQEKLSQFHKDITLHEDIRGSEQPQNTLAFFQLLNSSKFVFTASRGIYETDARGFRIVGIENQAITWIKSYFLPETYYYQLATCSAMDKNGDIWIGGHVFGNAIYGRPFLAKLNSSGEMLWSKLLVQQSGIEYSLRGVSLKTLQNGDLAFVTFSGDGYTLYKVTTDGQIKWAKKIESHTNLVFDDPFQLQYNISPINRGLTETSDGSIFIALNSNYPVKGKDVLVKVSSDGQLVFTKSYSSAVLAPCYPAQIVCTENDQIILADQKGGVFNKPYVYLLSKDGVFINGKAHPIDLGVQNPFALNELNYFNNTIHLTSAEGYEFSDYNINMSLSLESSEKIIGTNAVQTDYGGISVFDKKANCLFHILDIKGPGGGNGFQFLRTDFTGKSCQNYSTPPEQLILQPVTVIVKDETDIVLKAPAVRQFQDVIFQSASVSTSKQEDACNK